MAIIIATDGACLGNPGPGGWAFVVEIDGEVVHEDSGSSNPKTTNNRAELYAVLKALQWIEKSSEEPSEITILSDSQYVVKGLTEWIEGWKKKGWKNSKKEPVINRDLWERLDELNQLIKPKLQWVRGHNGHPLNERADTLANAAAGIG